MSGKAARDGAAPRRHCQRKPLIHSPVGQRERSAPPDGDTAEHVAGSKLPRKLNFSLFLEAGSVASDRQLEFFFRWECWVGGVREGG